MKYRKLRASHLERLIDYVDGGSSLESHSDVPSDSVETSSYEAKQEENRKRLTS